MISKISKGTGFYGVLLYAMDEKKGHYIDSNLDTYNGINPKEFSKQLAANNDLNSRVKKPVFHVAISLEKEAIIDDKKFEEIGIKFLEKFGFNIDGNDINKGITPYVMVRHTDTEHPHIHIIASRIDSMGNANNPSNDYKLANKISRELEKEYGLKLVSSVGDGVKKMQKDELEMRKRFVEKGKKIPDYRKSIRTQIDKNTRPVGGGKRPFKSFVKELKKAGIDINLNTNKEKTRVNGISFSIHKKDELIKYKGSSLGKNYTWNNIVSKLDFDIKRDLQGFDNTKGISPYYGKGIEEKMNVNKDQNIPNNQGGGNVKVAEKGSHGQYQEEPNKEELRAKFKRKMKRGRKM